MVLSFEFANENEDSWARPRGAQLTAGYTVNTYSIIHSSALACLSWRAYVGILGPGGPLPHAKNEVDRTTRSGDIIIIIKNEKIIVTLHVKNVTGALNIVNRNVTDGPKYGRHLSAAADEGPPLPSRKYLPRIVGL